MNLQEEPELPHRDIALLLYLELKTYLPNLKFQISRLHLRPTKSLSRGRAWKYIFKLPRILSKKNWDFSLWGNFIPCLIRKVSILNGYFEHANGNDIKCGLESLTKDCN